MKKTYIIKVETTVNYYVEADNYEEAINKLQEGDFDKATIISTYYENAEEDSEE